jgi:hypothetical protein
MKKYYSSTLLPLGCREETDNELRKRIKDCLDSENKNINIDFLFSSSRLLIPLKDGETVILRTLGGEMEMSEAHKFYGIESIKLPEFL